MNRLTTILAAACVILAPMLAGCGGATTATRAPEPDEPAAARPLEQFVRLMAQGRAGPACDQLTPRARRDLAAIAGASTGTDGGGTSQGCAVAVGLMTGARSERELAALQQAHVTRVRVRGDRARIGLRDIVAPDGVEAFDGSGGEGFALLVRGPGGWRIDGFG